MCLSLSTSLDLSLCVCVPSASLYMGLSACVALGLSANPPPDEVAVVEVAAQVASHRKDVTICCNFRRALHRHISKSNLQQRCARKDIRETLGDEFSHTKHTQNTHAHTHAHTRTHTQTLSPSWIGCLLSSRTYSTSRTKNSMRDP